jgi:hypothetical protein
VGDNGIRCSRPAFVRFAGIVQICCRARFRTIGFPSFQSIYAVWMRNSSASAEVASRAFRPRLPPSGLAPAFLRGIHTDLGRRPICLTRVHENLGADTLLTIVLGFGSPGPIAILPIWLVRSAKVRVRAARPSNLILTAIRERHSPRVLFSVRSLVLENAP